MAGESVIITIPGEPVAKGRPRFAKSGHAFTPAKTRSAEGLISLIGRAAMKGRAPFSGPISVDVFLVMGIPKSASKKRRAAMERGGWPTKRPDIDNLAKAPLDAMNGIVFYDDCQIVKLSATKVYGEAPRTVVTVNRLALEL